MQVFLTEKNRGRKKPKKTSTKEKRVVKMFFLRAKSASQGGRKSENQKIGDPPDQIPYRWDWLRGLGSGLGSGLGLGLGMGDGDYTLCAFAECAYDMTISLGPDLAANPCLRRQRLIGCAEGK